MQQRRRFSLTRAEAHLREADPVLGDLIARHGRYRPRPVNDPFDFLLRAVLRQQLAGAAANAIERRWRALYGAPDATPPPAAILATSEEAFRSTGVSRQKAAYLRDLAEHAAGGRIDFASLSRSADAEVVERLRAIHGIGEWTAQMFLMFALGRPDVLPVGDLGVRRGMQLAYGLPASPTPAHARAIGAPWSPYRSVGAWYMWRAAESPPPASA